MQCKRSHYTTITCFHFVSNSADGNYAIDLKYTSSAEAKHCLAALVPSCARDFSWVRYNAGLSRSGGLAQEMEPRTVDNLNVTQASSSSSPSGDAARYDGLTFLSVRPTYLPCRLAASPAVGQCSCMLINCYSDRDARAIDAASSVRSTAGRCRQCSACRCLCRVNSFKTRFGYLH